MAVGFSNGTQNICDYRSSLHLTAIRQQVYGFSPHSSGKVFHNVTRATQKSTQLSGSITVGQKQSKTAFLYRRVVCKEPFESILI